MESRVQCKGDRLDTNKQSKEKRGVAEEESGQISEVPTRRKFRTLGPASASSSIGKEEQKKGV